MSTELNTAVPAVVAPIKGVTEPLPLKVYSNPPPAAEPAQVEKKEEPAVVVDPLLSTILKTRRCHGSAGDISFRQFLVRWLSAAKVKHRISEPGNIIATVGKSSTTLFSCHIDTVHNGHESNSTQELFFDPSFGHIFLADKKASTCLGADDGAGIYVLLKMIKAKVPGTYIFHVGEERGCIGANAMLQREREFLKGFDRAIAFDRAGTDEVIVTQSGQQCASIDFGNSLAKLLTANNLPYEVSHKGMLTDVRVYAGVIPECVNLSVGYYEQHGSSEYLDVAHLEALVKACINIKWDLIDPVRVPPAIAPSRPYTPHGWKGLDDYIDTSSKVLKPANTPKYGSAFEQPVEPKVEGDDLTTMSKSEIEQLCAEDPYVASELILQLLEDYGALQGRVDALKRLLS